MKKLLTLSFLFILGMSAVFAQTETTAKKDTSYWKLKGVTGLNFSQTYLENWSAGGENAAAGNVYLNALLSYAKNHVSWDNTLDTEFGQIYTAQNGWNKGVDKLNFASKFGLTHNKIIYYSALLDFKTQYAKGYKKPGDEDYISTIMAPGYLNLALGIDYKPNASWTVFVSPVTGKMTFVLDDYLSGIGAFGVDVNKHLKTELGAYAKVGLNTKLHENVSLLSTVDFFTAYDDSFGNVDVNWDVLVSMKITKYLTATLNMSLKYDDDTKTMETLNVGGIDTEVQRGAKVQFKEVFGLGVSYTF